MRNLLYFAQPILVSLTTFNRLRTPVERRPICLPRRKRKEKEKEKEEKLQHFALKPEHGPRGIWRKAFKARCPKPSLVGSRRLSVRYTGGWVEFSKLKVLEFEIIRSPG